MTTTGELVVKINSTNNGLELSSRFLFKLINCILNQMLEVGSDSFTQHCEITKTEKEIAKNEKSRN